MPGASSPGKIKMILWRETCYDECMLTLAEAGDERLYRLMEMVL
jgi:hypothetical protein